MSQPLLVVLFVMTTAASAGMFGLALLLRWRDQQAAYQQVVEQHRRLTAIRHSQRQAEQRIDDLVLVALIEMAASTALAVDK